MEATTATASETNASIQFVLAIFTPDPANDRPIRMMTGPMTIGGNNFFINPIPKALTRRLMSI